MKLIIAGSRNLNIEESYEDSFILQMLNIYRIYQGSITEIVSGNSGNVDICGNVFSKNFGQKLTLFNPDWKTHGKAAGPIRNKQMAEYADALLLIWDGKSKGSSNMKKEMLKLKKPIYEVILRKYNV